MNEVVAIDPGSEKSAILIWNGAKVSEPAIAPNRQVRDYINMVFAQSSTQHLCIEMIASYGMPVGKEVFETCLWVGRFMEAWYRRTEREAALIYRQQVKLHHCNSVRAKDSNVRQALIDRFGKPGTKKQPGRTYGLTGDLWSAFAIATFAHDQIASGQRNQPASQIFTPHTKE